jgi:hypothetical protein
MIRAVYSARTTSRFLAGGCNPHPAAMRLRALT